MQTIDFITIFAVFQEMLGLLLWPLIILAILTPLLFVFLIIAERGLCTRRLVITQLIGLLGGVIALIIMAKTSSSGFSDAAGPLDWFLILFVYIVGFLGTTLLLYSLIGWLKALATP